MAFDLAHPPASDLDLAAAAELRRGWARLRRLLGVVAPLRQVAVRTRTQVQRLRAVLPQIERRARREARAAAVAGRARAGRLVAAPRRRGRERRSRPSARAPSATDDDGPPRAALYRLLDEVIHRIAGRAAASQELAVQAVLCLCGYRGRHLWQLADGELARVLRAARFWDCPTDDTTDPTRELLEEIAA